MSIYLKSPSNLLSSALGPGTLVRSLDNIEAL